MFENNHTSISISTGTMIRFALVIIGFFLIWFLRDLVLVVFTSIVIASFMESATPFFKRIGIGRVFGIVILYTISIIFVSGLFYLFAPLLITEIYNFANTISAYAPGISFLEYFKSSAFGGAKDIVNNLSKDFSLQSLFAISKTFIDNLSGGFVQTLSVAFGSIFNVIMIVLISFYLSVQEKGIENFLRIILPIKHEDYVVDLWDRSRQKIALWVKGQMLLAFVVAVLIYLILSLLGIEYALLLAIIAGIMELVPYGIIVALIPAIAFSYFSGGIYDAAMVAGSYFIIHEFDVFLFSPLVINKVVGLSPIVIILSVLIGFELSGIWGAILAIPMAVFFVEFSNDVEKHKIWIKSKKDTNEKQ